jgi:hypothetical protein
MKKDYGVEYVTVHDGMMKKHPWRTFDQGKIPKQFPTVPSMGFIEELYGVPIPTHLKVTWPCNPYVIPFDTSVREVDSVYYDTANGFSNDVAFKLNELASRQTKTVVRKLSPYKQPTRCYGFHAARFEFAIKYFGIRFNNMLDLGSHPGACAASALKYCDSVVCVSKKPTIDKRDFCPYVAKADNVVCVKTDADHFVPFRPFDLQHDDVDIVGSRSVEEDIELGLGMIRRARMNYRDVDQCLFTLKELSWRTKEELYSLYIDYGHIDFVKPHFSNPWKSEFIVYTKRVKGPRMRRAAFIRMLNGFLNSMAPQMFAWSELMLNALSGFEGVRHVPPNPGQSDEYEKEWIRNWDHN